MNQINSAKELRTMLSVDEPKPPKAYKHAVAVIALSGSSNGAEELESTLDSLLQTGTARSLVINSASSEYAVSVARNMGVEITELENDVSLKEIIWAGINFAESHDQDYSENSLSRDIFFLGTGAAVMHGYFQAMERHFSGSSAVFGTTKNQGSQFWGSRVATAKRLLRPETSTNNFALRYCRESTGIGFDEDTSEVLPYPKDPIIEAVDQLDSLPYGYDAALNGTILARNILIPLRLKYARDLEATAVYPPRDSDMSVGMISEPGY